MGVRLTSEWLTTVTPRDASDIAFFICKLCARPRSGADGCEEGTLAVDEAAEGRCRRDLFVDDGGRVPRELCILRASLSRAGPSGPAANRPVRQPGQ